MPKPGQIEDLDLPHKERVKKWGHRAYVGGTNPNAWYGIGKRQYHFLTAQGLESRHKFLDVACGSLRLGQFVIPMLDVGNYYGIDGEPDLVAAGSEHEFLFDVIEKKKPTFMFNYDFNVSDCPGYDYAIAQSLFTHLTLDDIKTCFGNLAPIANAGSKFFFTFFEGDEAANVHTQSHANKQWTYQFSTLKDASEAFGFKTTYIGDWGHERNQKMAVATM